MKCRVCNVELTYKNCFPSQKKNCKYICKLCHSHEMKKLYISNREQKLLYWQQYRQKNPEKIKQSRTDYYENNKEKIIEKNRIYFHTTLGRICAKKHVYKHRKLGYNPLNGFFEVSEPHHINKDDVIYVPKEWNHIVHHNVYTGKNMEIINAYAYFFLMQQNIKELSGFFRR